MPANIHLSPRAYRRVVREAVTQPFAKAADALNEDWGTDYDGKEIQRWSRKAGESLLTLQEAERESYQQGQRPSGPPNDPELLVLGMDGGRVQVLDSEAENGFHWREDKVLTITSYRPGCPASELPPVPLVTTYMATMQDSDSFGIQARLEAERRGIRQSAQTLVLGDGAQWIDTLHGRHFPRHHRIVDWYHAKEHLYDVARAVHPEDQARQEALAKKLTDLLWDGHVGDVVAVLKGISKKIGEPRKEDSEQHPRRVLHQNAGYFERLGKHMNYPAYRQRGWPIGSGVVESGVKQFNKRVKGTDQFWTESGVEAILNLRALWQSDDTRWDHYWNHTTNIRQAA